jgi:uncharacterized protein YxeA
MKKIILIIVIAIGIVSCTTETVTNTTINNNYYYGNIKDSIKKGSVDTIITYPTITDTIIKG